MEKVIKLNNTDYLQFFAFDLSKHIGCNGEILPTNITAPAALKDVDPALFHIEYYGNAESMAYNTHLLAQLLFKCRSDFFKTMFQDYRRPWYATGVNCTTSDPMFSFLTAAELVGIGDYELHNFGVIVYRLKETAVKIFPRPLEPRSLIKWKY